MNSRTLRWLSYRNHAILIITAIIILGGALRIYKLGHQSLWNDEIWSVVIASSSVLKILTVSYWRNTHEPLYYLILHFFMSFGNNEAILRLPSFIFGIMSIGLFYLILKNWLGKIYGHLGAFLLAISPFHVWYSQETRPYAMLLFLGLLSFFFLQKLLKHKTNQFRVGFIITTAVTYYCHSLALVLILFFMIYVILNISRQEWKNWIMTFGSILLIISPAFLPLLLNPPSHSADPFRGVHLDQIGYIFWAFGTGYALGPSLVELHYLTLGEVMTKYYLLIITVSVFIGTLLMWGFYKLWIKEKKTFLVVIFWLFIPIIFVLVGATISSHPINVRYVLLAFPAFIIALMVGIRELQFKWITLSALLCLVFISAYSLYNYYEKPKYQRENNRAASNYLAKHADNDDIIIVSASYVIKNLKHYYPNHSVVVGYPQRGTFVDKKKLEKELKEIISNRVRFWLFLSRTYHSDPKGLIRNFCDLNYQRVKHASWNGVELILYCDSQAKDSFYKLN